MLGTCSLHGSSDVGRGLPEFAEARQLFGGMDSGFESSKKSCLSKCFKFVL